MIYLTNTVSAQTVSIPRNDNGGTPSVNPRSYQSGYTDGVAYQKSLLSSTAITENGDYQSENGFSAVSVNVPQTGITIPLTSITITANTAITETEKAYTGITVNVPQTGYTQQDLDNAYSSGYTNGETVGENNIISTFSAMTATTNGNYGSSAHPLSSITVNVPQTGSSLPLSSITITGNTAITVNDKAYTGITVNVPQTAITSDVKYVDYIEINTSGLVGTGSTRWTFTDNIGNQSRITVNFDFMPLASNASGMHKFIDGPIYLRCDKPISNKKYDLKINGKYYSPWDGIVFNTNTRYNCYFSTETNVNNTAYVIINGNYFEVEYTDSASYARVVLNASGPINQGETFSTTTGRYYGIKVTSGSTILVDARPALDNNNNPCFYDIISNSYIYHTGNSIPVAGNLLSLEEVFNRYYDYGYNKGKADGYNTGYVSGETVGKNNIISTFSSTTATTNGVYGSSAHPLSSITVNVPQSGFIASGWVYNFFTLQATNTDALQMNLDITAPYGESFSYVITNSDSSPIPPIGIYCNNTSIAIYGSIVSDNLTYTFQNATPNNGRRIIIQININPNTNSRIVGRIYDFVDGASAYGVLSASSINSINQVIYINHCAYNDFKIIKNNVLVNDFKYYDNNGVGTIIDKVSGTISTITGNVLPFNS